MSNNLKKTKPKLRSNSGQAVLEIVLVLLVVMTMARLVWGLNKSVQEWGFSYFGDYFLCLIEVGELPSMGGSNAAGECNSQYQAFDWSTGRPPITGSSGGTNTSGGFNPNSTSGSSGNSAGSTNSGGSSGAASDAADTSRNSGNGARTRINSGINNDGSYAKQAGGSSGKEDSKKKIKVDDGVGIPSWAVNQNKGAAAGRPERMAVNRKYQLEDEARQVRGQERTNIAIKKKSSQDEEARSKKMKVRDRKTASVEATDSDGFSFGRLLRMLIILGIVVAIVVFFGSQALQISKDSD